MCIFICNVYQLSICICRHSRIAPSHRSSPQAISHGFPSVHPLVTPASLLPTGAFSPLFLMASPQAISHGFPSVHPVVTPVSLLPLPKHFPRFPFRPPCPPELSPNYFPRFPFRPPCRHSRIAPSHRSSPQAISHGFPSITLSSLPYRSFDRSSPQAIPHGFPSVHPLVTPVSLLPTGALPMLFPRFPLRPPNRCFHPFPPNGALPKLFPTVSPPSTQSSNPYRSLAANVTKREPKHRRCFWEKTIFGNWEFATTGKSLYELWVSIPQRIAIVQNAWDKLTLNLHPCRRLPRDGGIQLVAGGLAPRWRYL